jgi:hypothetical membrane protein
VRLATRHPQYLAVVTPDRLTMAAGLALASAGSMILMGIITGEALYPAEYTTFDNEISDLGATRPPNSISLEPSATIFNATMIVSGILVIGAGAILIAVHARRFLSIAVMLNGIGILGVGVFPGNFGAIHPWFAATAFIAGGLCGIAAARSVTGALRWFSLTLGVITLLSLAYIVIGGMDAPITRSLGDGGAERWVAYPVVLWQMVFGGALMGQGRVLHLQVGQSTRH